MKRLDKSTLFVKQFAELAISNPKVLSKIDRIIKNLLKDGLLNFNKGEKLKHYPNRYSCRIDTHGCDPWYFRSPMATVYSSMRS